MTDNDACFVSWNGYNRAGTAEMSYESPKNRMEYISQIRILLTVEPAKCEAAEVVRICITGNTMLVRRQDLSDYNNKYSFS